MLILARKVGETITIGDDVQVQVLSVKGGQVRVGIAAPRSIKVNREEVYFRLLEEAGADSLQAIEAEKTSGA